MNLDDERRHFAAKQEQADKRADELLRLQRDVVAQMKEQNRLGVIQAEQLTRIADALEKMVDGQTTEISVAPLFVGKPR